MSQNNWDNFKPTQPNFRKVLANVPWYGWQEQLKMPKFIKKEKVDLTHFPHWNVPYLYNGPFVATIHDLILLHFPTRRASTLSPAKYWFKNFAFRQILKHAARQAKKIITISEYSKNDIVKSLNVSTKKIEVTLLAPSSTNPITRNTYPAEALLTRCGLQGAGYVLYVGVAFPHKNLEKLVEAWNLYQKEHGEKYKLVLLGIKNYFYERLLNKIKKENIKNITYIDKASDQELQSIYQNAALYVMPSLFEGFGLPPLESLKNGVPVISSNATCLPEILGDAAYFFNANDVNEMAAAIHTGLSDQNLRQKLLNNAPKILAKYSWENTAKKTLEIYQSSV